MFKHEYECAVCHKSVSLTSTNPSNPLAGTLHTHAGIMDTSQRKSDPFLSGVKIQSTLGAPGKGCSGGLKYRGFATGPEPVATPKATGPLTPAQKDADAVYADMKKQYNQWHGQKYDRGAWWGPTRPGSKVGAKDVPQNVLTELKKLVAQRSQSWRFSDSFSGGISFHRSHPSSQIDFIYHMKRP